MVMMVRPCVTRVLMAVSASIRAMKVRTTCKEVPVSFAMRRREVQTSPRLTVTVFPLTSICVSFQAASQSSQTNIPHRCALFAIAGFAAIFRCALIHPLMRLPRC